MKRVIVLGAGGFIGSHMVKRLKEDGYYVTGVDRKHCEFSISEADQFLIRDLRIEFDLSKDFDEVYQFAADMGGCQFIFSGKNDADILSNSAQINLNTCKHFAGTDSKIFFASSACIYPQGLQADEVNDGLEEWMAYPADPDSEYGWEKLFSERLYLAYARNYKLDVRIGRFHNIYGPQGTYKGGREKAPASISRKIIEGDMRMWGDGEQTRSFLYIDDCIDAVRLLMASDFKEPVNIGSEESISISELWQMVIQIDGRNKILQKIERPENTLGVKGRVSENTLIRKELGWEPKFTLRRGLEKTYSWIRSQYDRD